LVGQMVAFHWGRKRGHYAFGNYDRDATFTAGTLENCRATVAFAAARGMIPAANEFGTYLGVRQGLRHKIMQAFPARCLRSLCRKQLLAKQ
jgi:hypothetical protein